MRRFCIVLCVVLTAWPIPAPAQQLLPEPQVVRIAAISPWVDATHPLKIVAQITNTTEFSLERVSVSVTVHALVPTRSELRAALDDGPTTGSVATTAERVETAIAPGQQSTVTVEREVARLQGAFGRTGVYPLTITVRHSIGESRTRTAVPFFASEPRSRLNVAWVLPVSRPTLRRGDGVYPSGVSTILTLDELTQQMDIVTAHPGAAITLAPNPSLLDALADLSDGFAVHGIGTVQALDQTSADAQRASAGLSALRRAAATAGEIATVPYAPVDMPSLIRGGLRADLLRQITVGRSVIETRLGATASRSLVPPGLALDGPTMSALAPLGIQQIVLGQGMLAQTPVEPFQPQNFGPSRPVAVRVGNLEMRALLADVPLSARIDGPEQGALLGQAIIAETASAWLELPLFAPERVLLIAPARTPSPTALRAALSGLTSAPWVRLRTVSDALSSFEPLGAPTSFLTQNRMDRPFLSAARNARRFLTTFSAIAPGSEPRAELESLDRLVLLAESGEWERDPQTGASLAHAATARVKAVFGGISVAARQVTLTSRAGEVPVTVLNGNPFSLNVRLRVQSPKLEFPNGDARIEELRPRNQTFDFPVHARAAGSFPLAVRIETPDGTRLLATGQLILRSTAVSRVALLAVGGGALFLLLASSGRGARRRRTAARD